MSKKIVLKALEEHLGRFVNGLSNLKVAVWQGEITLPDLTLKPEVSHTARGRRTLALQCQSWQGVSTVFLPFQAFDKLQLPFRVKSGHIKKFRLAIPWSKLGSESVKVTIEEVSILLVPFDKNRWDKSEAEHRAKLLKQRKIRWAELRSEVTADNKENGAGSFAKRLVMKVVENLQIKVKCVHIRFENLHESSCLGAKVETFGLLLEEFVFMRVNEEVCLFFSFCVSTST
jgi:hypothetical protein